MLLGGIPGSHCIAESFSHQWNALSKPKNLPTRHKGFCRDLSLALRMLARIEESSHKLFLHRQGAAAGRWPQAISPGLHRGLISLFASLGMSLGGCSKGRLSRFQSEIQKHLYTQREA